MSSLLSDILLKGLAGRSSPSLNFNFVDGSAFSPQITFTRASTATYFDATGTLQSAAIDVPRFDYDPATLAARGFLIEEARTNSIRNNTMQGAVAGTPGTLPTKWTVTVAAGLATNVIGTGTENGIAYIDIQFVGTASATTYSLSLEDSGIIAATTGQSWASSAFIKQTAGTQTGITSVLIGWAEQNSVPAFLAFTTGIITVNTTGSLASSKKTFSAANVQATTAFVRPALILSVTSGAAIDITLRIGLPQLEQGAFVTSVIPTTTTALTRSADVASVNTLSPWFNATEGTLFADFQDFAPPSGTTIGRRAAEINSGSTPDMIAIGYGLSVNENFGFVRSASVTQFNLDTVGTPSAKVALAYKDADFALCANGTSVVPQASGSVPSGMTQMDIGNSVDYTAVRAANGHLRRITYYPRRLSNAELQGLTA